MCYYCISIYIIGLSKNKYYSRNITKYRFIEDCNDKLINFRIHKKNLSKVQLQILTAVVGKITLENENDLTFFNFL